MRSIALIAAAGNLSAAWEYPTFNEIRQHANTLATKVDESLPFKDERKQFYVDASGKVKDMWNDANENEDFAAVTGWLAEQKDSLVDTVNDPDFALKLQFVKEMAIEAGKPVVAFVQSQAKAGSIAFEKRFEEWKKDQLKNKKKL